MLAPSNAHWTAARIAKAAWHVCACRPTNVTVLLVCRIQDTSIRQSMSCLRSLPDNAYMACVQYKGSCPHYAMPAWEHMGSTGMLYRPFKTTCRDIYISETELVYVCARLKRLLSLIPKPSRPPAAETLALHSPYDSRQDVRGPQCSDSQTICT